MRKFLDALVASLKSVTREGLGLIGCGLISLGAWMVYAPLGFIVCGVLLVAGAVLAPKAD